MGTIEQNSQTVKRLKENAEIVATEGGSLAFHPRIGLKSTRRSAPGRLPPFKTFNVVRLKSEPLQT